MRYLVKKDKIYRNLFSNFEIKRFLLKNVAKNKNFSIKTSWKGLLKVSKSLKLSSFVCIVNRCVFTGRKGRVNKFFSFSRIIFLRLSKSGLITGLKKAAW